MLEQSSTQVAEERSSRKEPLSDKEASELLARARRVLVARGRSLRRLDPGAATLSDLKGPTGNYRAPILLAGDTLLVGFHRETLEELV